MTHQSDSAIQRGVESLILEELSGQLGVDLAPQRLVLLGGSYVDIDGVDPTGSILVEVFAHHGRLRGGQFHKVARDALKLITVARANDAKRMLIVMGDDEAAACVTGKSWLAEALRTWGVEVVVAQLDQATREGVLAAQRRQVMVNVPPVSTGE